MRAGLILAAMLIGSPAFAQATLKGDAVKGASLFKSRCAMCHSVEADKPKATAPTLAGIVGRKAGSLPQARYSAALKASGVTWTAATLDKFLTSPRDVVKGTNMIIKLAQPQDRADVIAYFATLKGSPVK